MGSVEMRYKTYRKTNQISRSKNLNKSHEVCTGLGTTLHIETGHARK